MPQILSVRTCGKGFTDITPEVAEAVSSFGITSGVAHLFVQHTSASLVIQENADPDVLEDLKDYFEQIAPEEGSYRHDAEGPDDMPAHIRSALTLTSVSIPVESGRMMLGTWQGIYLFEHRRAPHTRRIIVSVTRAD